MSVERRAMLRKDMRFESGLVLKRGTIVYVEEYPSGWSAHHYNDKGSGTVFLVEPEDVSIFRRGDTTIEELVVIPDPPESDEKLREQRELGVRRLRRTAESYREEAAKLDALAAELEGTEA